MQNTIKKLTYTYSDSEAGMQNISFDKLSDLIAYIENFGSYGESCGIIFFNDNPILEYNSNFGGLFFYATI